MTDSHRPFLPRTVPVLRVAPGTLQIGGADGDPGLRVGPLPAGAAQALAALLRGLDGDRPVGAVLAEAVAAGLDRAVVVDVLDALRACGQLLEVSSADLLAAARTPAARARTEVELPAALAGGSPGTWRRRRVAAVVVEGATRVGVPLAAMLAASGVGRVHVRDRGTVGAADTVVGGLSAADEGRPRTLAAADAVRRVAPDVDLRPLPPGTVPDLLVLTRPWAAVDPLLGHLHADRVAHLVATVRGEVGVVGPLVVPGRTGCLRCAEATRTECAPGWPALATQLRELPTARAGPPSGPITGSTGLCAATAVTALTQALGHLDGTAAPVALDAALELRSPDLLPRRRAWPAHPGCACRAAGPRWVGRPGGPAREQGHWGA